MRGSSMVLAYVTQVEGDVAKIEFAFGHGDDVEVEVHDIAIRSRGWLEVIQSAMTEVSISARVISIRDVWNPSLRAMEAFEVEVQ